MGFGLICAGYSTLMFLRLVPVELIGFWFVLKGLRKLCGYNKYFEYAKRSVYGILAFSLADVIYWIISYFKIISSDLAEQLFTICHRLVFLPFYIFLFMAIRVLSKELDFDKGTKRASLAMSVVAVYYLVFLVSRFDTPILQYLFAAETVFYILMFLVTEATVFLCCRAITTDEAEQKEEEALRRFDERFGKNKNKSKISEPPKKTFKQKKR